MSEDSGETSQERAPIIVSPRRTGSNLADGTGDHTPVGPSHFSSESTPTRASVKSVIVRVGSSPVSSAYKSEVWNVDSNLYRGLHVDGNRYFDKTTCSVVCSSRPS